MHNFYHHPLLLLLGIFSATKCTVRAHDVGLDWDPEDGESWELDYGYYPYKSYQTTDLTSPAFRKLIDQPQCHDGLYTFFTPRGGAVAAPGPMIVDNDGELIWAKGSPDQAYDLVMHEIEGQQYLTYWMGDDRVRGHGQGDYYMLNSSYQQVAKISAKGNLKADLHEMAITDDLTALITVYEVYKYDLSDQKKFSEEELKDGTYIWDCLFQEIDLKTDELVFQWRASDHHKVDESFHAIGGDGSKDSPWDWYHMNSIQKDALGNYLVSARYTHTITYINGSSGDILWILGGKRNYFQDLSDGAATKHAWQHDARLRPLNTFPVLMAERIRDLGFWEGETTKDGVTTQLVTFFDNSAEDRHMSDDRSHGMLLEISYPSVQPEYKNNIEAVPGDLSKRWSEPAPKPANSAFTARLIKTYDHPQGIVSSSQGSMQVIPSPHHGQDPKIFLGYGFNAVFTEYNANGDAICDTHFATNYSWERGDVQSYRAFKFPWVGRPMDPPTAVLGDDAIFVSWNGATEVKSYVLQHSAEFETEVEGAWTDVAQVDKTGFETMIEFQEDAAQRYLRVLALDAAGRVLGVSRGMDLGWTTGLISHVIPELVGGNVTPVKLLMLFACNVTALFVLWEGYRKFLEWRRQRAWRRFKEFRSDAEYF